MADIKNVTDEIFNNLKQFGFLPVPVQEINPEAETVRYFGGTFQEFVDVAKALGSKCVFVETLYLEDEEFYYDSGIEDDEECCGNCCGNCSCECDESDKDAEADKAEELPIWLDPKDMEGMDLSLLKPELDKYNERVGDECGVRLTLPGPDHLQVEIFTDWYNDFASLVDDASEEIELDPKAALEKMQKAAKDKE
ncbi:MULTISPECIES: hypothetical protein [Fibrobacter]|uniref:hypothetical protein n=1 Tax=Fibrobacter TaxID=832 RepID=UPI000BB13737|nr:MULTISPECIES: hypothetical protein [Fibrobacter]MDD7299473.1 hypothetical protein [Fibrobacter intestinalis]PBC67790.1 hypothetical protein BGX14_0114 [Fibrobacter sp. UWS1]